MNSKLAKELRKVAEYSPSTDRAAGDDYNIVDTSKVIGYNQRGVNADGTPILQKVIAYQCTATLKDDCKRGKYRQLKRLVKNAKTI